MPHADAAATPPRLLLVGAGHAHLQLLRHAPRFGDAEMMLVDPGGFWYSARAAGMLSGRLTPDQDRVDPLRLARRHGAIAVRGRLAALDRQGKEAILEDGRRLSYTLLSLNLGSTTLGMEQRLAGGTQVWPVKPLPSLLALRRSLLRAFTDGQRPCLVVAGGGPSGVEIACALHALARRHAARCRITLVCKGPGLVPDAPAGAQRWLARLMQRRGIEVLPTAEVSGTLGGGVAVRVDPSRSGEDSLSLLEADHLILASGLVAPPVLSSLGLPCYPERGLAVEDTLQSLGDPDIFAAGDCAAMRHHLLPRLGVYGIRQAPILAENLAARLAGRPLTPYRPQPRALAILDLSLGLGLAIHGQRWWAGRGALLWKRWLDHRFMQQLR